MTSTKPGIATVPPPTLEKQLEVLAAARSLATPDDEFWRRRRAEIAAIRRDAGAFFCQTCPHAVRVATGAMVASCWISNATWVLLVRRLFVNRDKLA